MWRNLLGTVETTFSIGKGRTKFDASAVTAARTVALPNGNGTAALCVPTTLAAADVFHIPTGTQALFNEEISLDNGAEISIDGVLVEVS